MRHAWTSTDTVSPRKRTAIETVSTHSQPNHLATTNKARRTRRNSPSFHLLAEMHESTNHIPQSSPNLTSFFSRQLVLQLPANHSPPLHRHTQKGHTVCTAARKGGSNIKPTIPIQKEPPSVCQHSTASPRIWRTDGKNLEKGSAEYPCSQFFLGRNASLQGVRQVPCPIIMPPSPIAMGEEVEEVACMEQ